MLDTTIIRRDDLFPSEHLPPVHDAYDPEEVSPDHVRQEAFCMRSVHREYPEHALIPLRMLLWQSTATVRYLLRDQPARYWDGTGEAAWRRWHRDLSDWRSARRYVLNTYLMALRATAAKQAAHLREAA